MTGLPAWIGARSLPTAAVEIAEDHVAAILLSTNGRGAQVTSQATERLPAGAVVPHLTEQNIYDRQAVGDAVARVLARIGNPRRIGLAVPDPIGKVSLVRFEQVPERREDLDGLIRFQMRKTAPFPLDDAQVSWSSSGDPLEPHEFVVTVARREVVEEYEAMCAAAKAHAGLVDLSTMGLANAVLSGSRITRGDWLLIRVASRYASLAVFRGSRLLFIRTMPSATAEQLTDLVHQTAMYYEDRLAGTGFSQVIWSEPGNDAASAAQVRAMIGERLSASVEDIENPTIAPLVGLLAQDEAAR